MMDGYCVDAWGMRYCQEHRETYLRCYFCSRLIPPNRFDTADGALAGLPADRVRCPTCRHTAVESETRLSAVRATAHEWIRSEGLLLIRSDLQVELSAQRDLASEDGAKENLGVARHKVWTADGCVTRKDSTGIALLRGMPAWLCLLVLVHEYGHVWLAEQRLWHWPRWSEEGFCTLLEWRWCAAHPSGEACYWQKCLESNPDPIYGDGLRQVRSICERYGFPVFIRYILRTQTLPR